MLDIDPLMSSLLFVTCWLPTVSVARCAVNVPYEACDIDVTCALAGDASCHEDPVAMNRNFDPDQGSSFSFPRFLNKSIGDGIRQFVGMPREADANQEGESDYQDLEGIPLQIFVFMNSHPMNDDLQIKPNSNALALPCLCAVCRTKPGNPSP